MRVGGIFQRKGGIYGYGIQLSEEWSNGMDEKDLFENACKLIGEEKNSGMFAKMKVTVWIDFFDCVAEKNFCLTVGGVNSGALLGHWGG
jgi:hypothetical protein